MRIFSWYVIGGIFIVTMLVSATLQWERYGFGFDVIFLGALGLAVLLITIFEATSLKPKISSRLPTGLYRVLEISPETNPGHGRTVILKRWPDESDEYGSPQILCVRLDPDHEMRLLQPETELELVRVNGGKTKFVPAPRAVTT